jgi:hypothetical protein
MSARERELLEESLKTLLVLGCVTVGLTPDTFQVEVGDQAWSTVTRTRNDKGIKVVLLDHTVEVDVSATVRRCSDRFPKIITYVNDCPASLPQ